MIVTSREQIYPAAWQQLLTTYPAMQRVAWDLNGPEHRVLDWCAHSGVSCLPLSPAFLAQRETQPRLHFVYDGHWTPAGHALAARTMADFLRASGSPLVQYAEGSMKYGEGMKTRFGIAGELLSFLWQQKMWWLIPMVLVLLAFGGLMVTAQSSALGPFIYTLF